MNIDILNDVYYDEMIWDLHMSLYDTKHSYNAEKADALECNNFLQKKLNIIFGWPNNESNGKYIIIEYYNSLYSYDILIDDNFVSLIENKRESLDDMFYEYNREINIIIPKIILNLLFTYNYNNYNNKLNTKNILGYNLFKEFIKNK